MANHIPGHLHAREGGHAITGTHGGILLLPMEPDATARRLDRLADAELQLGHHAAAERLAWQAAEMWGVA